MGAAAATAAAAVDATALLVMLFAQWMSWLRPIFAKPPDNNNHLKTNVYLDDRLSILESVVKGNLYEIVQFPSKYKSNHLCVCVCCVACTTDCGCCSMLCVLATGFIEANFLSSFRSEDCICVYAPHHFSHPSLLLLLLLFGVLRHNSTIVWSKSRNIDVCNLFPFTFCLWLNRIAFKLGYLHAPLDPYIVVVANDTV